MPSPKSGVMIYLLGVSCHMSGVKCQVSHVGPGVLCHCQVSCFMCHLSQYREGKRESNISPTSHVSFVFCLLLGVQCLVSGSGVLCHTVGSLLLAGLLNSCLNHRFKTSWYCNRNKSQTKNNIGSLFWTTWRFPILTRVHSFERYF